MPTIREDLISKFSERYMRIERYKDCMFAPLPHYLPAEQLIFCEWVREYDKYGEYIFDLPLYPSLDEWKGRVDSSVLEAMKYLLALKIDALRFITDDRVELIEVKRRATASGIGQLLVYAEKLRNQVPGIIIDTMSYVVAVATNEIRASCSNMGIKLYVLPWLSYLGLRYKIGER
ncbi:MAG: hypothetical protein RMI85_03600 [Candidatus Korarchaeum sp.]|nr:hypothetical protein [Candidatus Korarchaeum sp.]